MGASNRYGATLRAVAAIVAVSAFATVGCSSGRGGFHENRTPSRTNVDVGALKVRGLRLIAPPPGSTQPPGYLVMGFYNSGTHSDSFVRAVVNDAGHVAAAGVTTAAPRQLVRVGAVQPSGIDPALPVTGLQQPLKAGSSAKVSLFFADAGHVSVSVPIDHFSLARPTKTVFTPAPSPSSATGTPSSPQ